MVFEKIPVSKIKAAEYNPRVDLKPGDAEYQHIENSINKFGYLEPIIWNKRTGNIVGGHQRFKILLSQGLKEVECIVVDFDTEQEKACNLALNKAQGLWDEDKLKALLFELQDGAFNMLDFGFEDIEAAHDDHESGGSAEDDDFDVDKELEDIQEPTVKRGDVWRLGNHYLMCGDATSKEDVEKLMSAFEKADGGVLCLIQASLLVTDPPYNVDYQGGTDEKLKIMNDKMESKKFREFLASAFDAASNCLKPGAAFYIWYASKEHINFEKALNDAGFDVRQQLIWVKNSLVLSRHDYHYKHEPCLYGWKDGAAHKWFSDRKQTTVLEFDKPLKNDMHPTMKPVDLIGYQIINSSRKGDVVLDIFGGSGTTLIACEQLDRQCRMMELDPKYCDVIIKRWEALTGKKAEMIS